MRSSTITPLGPLVHHPIEDDLNQARKVRIIARKKNVQGTVAKSDGTIFAGFYLYMPGDELFVCKEPLELISCDGCVAGKVEK